MHIGQLYVSGDIILTPVTRDSIMKYFMLVRLCLYGKVVCTRSQSKRKDHQLIKYYVVNTFYLERTQPNEEFVFQLLRTRLLNRSSHSFPFLSFP